MPLRDGPGPLGLGPGSGRRNDNCYAGFGYRNISRGIFHGRQGLAAQYWCATLLQRFCMICLIHLA